MSATQVLWAGNSYVGETLTDAEQGVLNRHVMHYLASESAALAGLFSINKDAILNAAMVAKAQFLAPFAGMVASDAQVGVTLIRAGHVMRTTATTETCNNSWSFAFSSGTNQNWIGYSTSNGTAINVDKQLLLLILGVEFTQGGSPIVEEVIWTVGPTTYPTQVIRHAWQGDNTNRIRLYRTYPMFALPKDTLRAVTTNFAGATNELVVLGLAFGYGRFLRSTSYSTVSL